MVMSGPGTVTNTTQGGSQGRQLSAVLIVNCDNPMTNVRIFPSVTVIPVGENNNVLPAGLYWSLLA